MLSKAQCPAWGSTEAEKIKHLPWKELIGSQLWVANSTRSTVSSAASMFKPSLHPLQDQYIGRHLCMNSTKQIKDYYIKYDCNLEVVEGVDA